MYNPLMDSKCWTAQSSALEMTKNKKIYVNEQKFGFQIGNFCQDAEYIN